MPRSRGERRGGRPPPRRRRRNDARERSIDGCSARGAVVTTANEHKRRLRCFTQLRAHTSLHTSLHFTTVYFTTGTDCWRRRCRGLMDSGAEIELVRQLDAGHGARRASQFHHELVQPTHGARDGALEQVRLLEHVVEVNALAPRVRISHSVSLNESVLVRRPADPAPRCAVDEPRRRLERRRGFASASASPCRVCPRSPWTSPRGTKHEHNATSWWWSSPRNTPLNMSSVTSSSSGRCLSSTAARPLSFNTMFASRWSSFCSTCARRASSCLNLLQLRGVDLRA